MLLNENTLRPLPNSEDLQHLVERFHRARWITGMSMVSPGPFSMDFTLLGAQRMRQLFEVFDGATADNFPDQSDFRATESGKVLMDQFSDAMRELCPPHLSPGEKDLLLGAALVFVKRQGI